MWQAADQAYRFAYAKSVAVIESEANGCLSICVRRRPSIAGEQSGSGSLSLLCRFGCGLSINRVHTAVFMKQFPEQDKKSERR